MKRKMTPKNIYCVNEQCSYDINNQCNLFTNQCSFRINRLKYNSMNFCFKGEINNKHCIFRIDTSSDVSILNDNLVRSDESKVKINNCNLKYPTGEKVAIDYKMYTTIW